MRFVKNPQMQIGEIDISEIKFDPKSRDEVPQILRGLQFIYTNIDIRTKVFEILENRIGNGVNKKTGRPGMDLWSIFVMGALRLNSNWNYDKLQNEVNYHSQIRQMLGHGLYDGDKLYNIQTIIDNVRLLTVEVLDEINQFVIEAGHSLVKKKETSLLHGRCDSFVVETHVHFPTDINLLFDAMRKAIMLSAEICERHELSDWRQRNYNIRQLKKQMRNAQNKKRGQNKDDSQKKEIIIKAHQEYIDVAQMYLNKVIYTAELFKNKELTLIDIIAQGEIEKFIIHAERQIDQVKRRVIFGEVIPHNEKVFSIFQPHTEWISKGKAGVPVELGLRVCILEDQYQFILHHQVMEKITDDQVALSMVTETRLRFPELKIVSFDKGFHSPDNQESLSKVLNLVALPRKGKLSKAAQAIENSDEFREARRKHSAVESAINALEVHGLDVCPDHGIDGFKRYVALAIVARNIQRIGAILQDIERKRLARKNKKEALDNQNKSRAA